MKMFVLPAWRDGSGTTCGPLSWPAVPESEVWNRIQEGLALARRARGTDPHVDVVDDMTGRLIATVRPGSGT